MGDEEISRQGPVRQEQGRPMDPDEFVGLENERAARAMPDEVVETIERPRLSIYVPEGELEPERITRSQDDEHRWELELPPGATTVRPGRESGRLAIEDVMAAVEEPPDAGELAPSRPKWVDYTPHAKLAAETRSLMRRVDGSVYEPHYGVFGADNRQVYYPAGYPWTCIGKVLVWNDWSNPNPSWWGSGVLIGDRTVLTAGHVAPWGSSNWAMRFIPAFYDGGSTLGAGVGSYVSDYWGYDTDSVSAWDMVVLRMYDPLGVAYGYFGTKDYHPSWEGGNYWTLAGYPGAIASGNRPSRQMWWPVLDDDASGAAEEVEYEADSSGGNSGGPAFGFWGGLPYAIATHSGGSKTTFLWWTTEDTNVGAGGGALNSLVAWARANWPA